MTSRLLVFTKTNFSIHNNNQSKYFNIIPSVRVCYPLLLLSWNVNILIGLSYALLNSTSGGWYALSFAWRNTGKNPNGDGLDWRHCREKKATLRWPLPAKPWQNDKNQTGNRRAFCGICKTVVESFRMAFAYLNVTETLRHWKQIIS